VIEHPEHGRVYAYEVDGLGESLLMDDANMPSLLGIPLTGYAAPDDPTYLATRQLLLSPENPYYYSGTHAAGIGSPHTPPNYVWHIALAVQGISSTSAEERQRLLELLRDTTGGTGKMHEGFDVDDPSRYTREWFSWANAMFCELALVRRDQVTSRRRVVQAASTAKAAQ
jgi:meiotically up-regulated gene 157 (Mug157) protein